MPRFKIHNNVIFGQSINYQEATPLNATNLHLIKFNPPHLRNKVLYLLIRKC